MSILKGRGAKMIEGTIKTVGYFSVLPVVLIVIYIILKGVPSLSWEFLVSNPTDGMRAGGIFPAIVGSVLLTIGTIAVSVSFGILTGILLVEYSKDNIIRRDKSYNSKSCRNSKYHIRTFRNVAVRNIFTVWFINSFWSIDSWNNVSSCNNNSNKGSTSCNTKRFEGSFTCSWSNKMGDNLENNSSNSTSGNTYRNNFKYFKSGRRNCTDYVYSCSILSSIPSNVSLGSGNGSSISPLCNSHSSSKYAGGYNEWNSVCNSCAYSRI